MIDHWSLLILLVLLLPLLLHLISHFIQVGNLSPVPLIHELLLLLLVVSAESCIQTRLAQLASHLLQALLVDDGVAGHLGEGDIGAEDTQSGVAGRSAITLHVDYPRWRLIVRNAQGHAECLADQAWLELLGLALILLALVVGVSEDSQVTFCLVLEKGIMQDRIFDINLSQLRIHTFFQLLSNHFGPIPFRKRVTQFADTCSFDELWQFEHRFQDAALSLQELRFLIPMSWDWNGIFEGFKLAEEERIWCCDVPGFNQIWPFGSCLQICHFQPPHLLLLRS